MAFESELVTAASVNVVEFPDLVRQYRVTGVPKTVVNGKVEILGMMEDEEFTKRVLGM